VCVERPSRALPPDKLGEAHNLSELGEAHHLLNARSICRMRSNGRAGTSPPRTPSPDRKSLFGKIQFPFGKIQFPYKSVNVSFIITHMKKKLTIFCGIDFYRTT
jgi:hypothetical protein